MENLQSILFWAMPPLFAFLAATLLFQNIDYIRPFLRSLVVAMGAWAVRSRCVWRAIGTGASYLYLAFFNQLLALAYCAGSTRPTSSSSAPSSSSPSPSSPTEGEEQTAQYHISAVVREDYVESPTASTPSFTCSSAPAASTSAPAAEPPLPPSPLSSPSSTAAAPAPVTELPPSSPTAPSTVASSPPASAEMATPSPVSPPAELPVSAHRARFPHLPESLQQQLEYLRPLPDPVLYPYGTFHNGPHQYFTTLRHVNLWETGGGYRTSRASYPDAAPLRSGTPRPHAPSARNWEASSSSGSSAPSRSLDSSSLPAPTPVRAEDCSPIPAPVRRWDLSAISAPTANSSSAPLSPPSANGDTFRPTAGAADALLIQPPIPRLSSPISSSSPPLAPSPTPPSSLLSGSFPSSAPTGSTSISPGRVWDSSSIPARPSTTPFAGAPASPLSGSFPSSASGGSTSLQGWPADSPLARPPRLRIPSTDPSWSDGAPPPSGSGFGLGWLIGGVAAVGLAAVGLYTGYKWYIKPTPSAGPTPPPKAEVASPSYATPPPGDAPSSTPTPPSGEATSEADAAAPAMEGAASFLAPLMELLSFLLFIGVYRLLTALTGPTGLFILLAAVQRIAEAEVRAAASPSKTVRIGAAIKARFRRLRKWLRRKAD